ncbi:MAG: alpha/beta hydrolase-fold protein [Saprospiraceae bacterium]
MYKIFHIALFVLMLNTSYSCHSKGAPIYSESIFYIDSIYSNNLSEYRKYNIYLPKGFDREKKYKIIYGADGEMFKDVPFIKATLDSLINNHIIKPTIYIGSYSNHKIADSTSTISMDGKKLYLLYRNFEYTDRDIQRIEDSLLVNRFQNHMLYFKDELIVKLENKFNQKNNKSDRLFYGFSNGAGFGINLLIMYPNLIGTYICYSALGSKYKKNVWNKKIQYPDLYIQYGNKESEMFKVESEALKAKYNELNSFVELRVFNGGHDIESWNTEFTKTISEILKIE